MIKLIVKEVVSFGYYGDCKMWKTYLVCEGYFSYFAQDNKLFYGIY